MSLSIKNKPNVCLWAGHTTISMNSSEYCILYLRICQISISDWHQ